MVWAFWNARMNDRVSVMNVMDAHLSVLNIAVNVHNCLPYARDVMSD